jgi:hypothetical protein
MYRTRTVTLSHVPFEELSSLDYSFRQAPVVTSALVAFSVFAVSFLVGMVFL